MDVQTIELAPEIQYFLDCAAEGEEISGATHVALNLFGDRKAVMEIVDRDAGGFHWKRRMVKCEELDAMAFAMIADAPDDIREALTAIALLSAFRRAESSAQVMSWWNFEDSVKGGCLQEYKKNRLCDEMYYPTKKVRRRLYAPSAIRRYVKQTETVHNGIVPYQRRQAARINALPWPASQAARHGIDHLHSEQRDAIRRANAKRIAETKFLNELAAKRQAESGERLNGIARPTRRMLARAAAFAISLLGAATVSDFVHGKAVDIPGQHMTISVARSHSLAAIGHSALDITVKAPDGTPLCKLCFYIDKTPALDQLAAIAMFVQAGEENEIFGTGNIFAVTDSGKTHPLLAERLANKFNADPMEGARTVSDFDLMHAASQNYEVDTVHLYLDALLTMTWGRRDATRLRRWAEAA